MTLPAQNTQVETEQLTLWVDGQRSVEGGLTLGQRNVMQWVTDTPGSINSVVSGTFDIPAGTTLADVMDSLRILVARHEALRTTYLVGAFPLQRISNRVAVPVLLLAGTDPHDPEGVANRLSDLVTAQTPEVPVDGSPLCVGIATAQHDACGVVAAVFAISHMALDHRAKELLIEQLRTMLASPGSRVVGDRRHQPYDQATAESNPVAVRKAEASLRHWAKLLTGLPPVPYAVGGTDRSTGVGAAVSMRSVAAGCALDHIVARAKTTRASAVMAAVCATVARRMDWPEQVFITVSANRFEARLNDYIGSLAQGCIARVDTTGAGFDTVAKRCWAATVQAAAHGAYDATALTLITKDIATGRGIHPILDPLFNCSVVESRGSATQQPVDLGWIARAVAETTLTARPMAASAMPVRFELYHVEGALVLEAWSGDTGAVSQDELGDLLRSVERLLVAAANFDMDHAAIDVTIGMPAVARGPQWRRLDGCWIELDQIRKVTEQALASARPVRVFEQVAQVRTARGADEGALVAYLVATDSVRTPRQAHTRVMAALPGHPTAMAPRHYVLCASAPADPECLADWQAQPVVMAGSGRPAAAPNR